MAWEVKIWFGYNGRYGNGFNDPVCSEVFDTKAEAIAKGEELLADGYTTNIDGVHHHFPAAAITHVTVGEYVEPEEE